MKKLFASSKIYFGLVAVLAFFAAINIFLPQGDFLPILPEEEFTVSKQVLAFVNAFIMLILYGGLGFIGLKLSRKLGFPDLWDHNISHRQRFLIPALIGIGLGIFFIIVDVIISQFHFLGPLPHPPFPTSLVASITAAIGEEIIFRLFFISFWVWLISHVLLKKRWYNQVFWIIAVISAFAFAIGHIPSVMIIFGMERIGEIPFLLLFKVFLLNGVLSIFTAYYFSKFGFLAPVGIHFWTDVVWHVIWGAI